MDKELLLYNYFSNQLTEDQEQLFNTLLETDTDFKAQFDFEKNLKRVIKKAEHENLKAKLHGFEKEIEKEVPVTKPKWAFGKWSMAASILILIGVGWFAYNSMSASNYHDLYNDNFEAYPNTVYTITRGAENQSSAREAFTAYELGEYEKAAAIFESAEQEGIAHLDFYLAQSYLNLGKNEEAIELFAKVILEDDEFEAEANWYLALAYLKKEDKANAIAALKRQIKNYEFNRAKATTLLQALD